MKSKSILLSVRKPLQLLAAVVCAVLALAGPNSVHAAGQIELNKNGDFEDPTPPLPGQAGGSYGTNSCVPWSYWGNSAGLPNCNPTNAQGAITNVFMDASNPSPRIWANHNNPFYVNVASQNNGNHRPATGIWFIPGATYTMSGQFYVKSDQIILGCTQARAGLYFSMNTGPAGQVLGNFIRALDPRYYNAPTAEPPTGPVVPIIDPVIIPDQWNTKTINWVFPGPAPHRLDYPSWRIFGGDGTRFLGVNSGTPPTAPATPVPNPGGYIDNASLRSDAYRNDLWGYVKDGDGAPIAGATVILSQVFDTNKDVVTTGADGRYTLPTFGAKTYTYTVTATNSLGVTANSPQAMVVSDSGNGQFPDLVFGFPTILKITAMNYSSINDQLTLTWISAPGATYTIENSTQFTGNGAGTSWDNLTTGIPSGGATTTAVIDAPSPGTYYRIRKE